MDERITLIDKVVEWLKGQPFSNVMAFLQLGTIFAAVYVALFNLIPEERKAIIEGLNRQEVEQSKQIERVATSFEKALDRMENRYHAMADQ